MMSLKSSCLKSYLKILSYLILRHLKSVYNATFVDCKSPLDLLNSIYRMQLQSTLEICALQYASSALYLSLFLVQKAISAS